MSGRVRENGRRGRVVEVERTGAALLTHRPTIGKRDVPRLLWRAARWPSPA